MPRLYRKKYDITVARMWGDTIDSLYVDSLVEMILFTQDAGYRVFYDKATQSWHSDARNELAEQFQGDWLFMTDTDHQFPPDSLVRLLRLAEKYKLKVIAIPYCHKKLPHHPIMGVWENLDKYHPTLIMDWERNLDVMTVGCVGGGALLIHRSVFQQLAREFPGERPFDIRGPLSEDYSFCWRCMKAGIKIAVAPKLEWNHIVKAVVRLKNYQPPKNFSYGIMGAKDGVLTGNMLDKLTGTELTQDRLSGARTAHESGTGTSGPPST